MTGSGDPDRPAPRILVLEHDEAAPVARLGDWLREAGAELTVVRLHRGDSLPAPAGTEPGSRAGSTAATWDGIVCMGGRMGAAQDDVAPWLPATRGLLAAAVDARVPTLGVCLGAQLLALATGGSVDPGLDGPEIGAHLAAKRDAANTDPLFGPLPMTPDVMHFHDDVVSDLPPGAVLLMSSTGYPHQAYRVGPAAWGLQFHIETTAAAVREWAATTGQPSNRRLADPLDEAEAAMADVWAEFAARFVEVCRFRPSRRVELGVTAR